ncbi:hypothetical protein PRIPAC_84667 [Pristionchus pacificus]|uniref:Uncharacterized protein n=1 Tax=Pristionchus pacificus TaxID=54126 RepID=A0A2A6C9V5_PRIPA|nr:hypothetical protein PRIPAC_84667 [Pristionchus pacificus]|eukprot:PDM74843.1 hypothetical protein PRIPAC_43333 [Pristionchus pacificus]
MRLLLLLLMARGAVPLEIGSTPLAGEDDFSCLEEALISSSPDSSLLPSSTLITGSGSPNVYSSSPLLSTHPDGSRSEGMHTSTTDWRSKPVKSSLAATTIEWTTPRTDSNPEFCERPCPDDFFESAQGCLWLYSITSAYATGLGNCQAIPNGDMISELDIEANFDGIQALMAAFKFPSHNFYVNGFMGDLNRKEKKARVVYISATTSLMTRNVTTVPRGEDQKDIGTICKVPKNCLRWSCALSYALQDAPYIEFDTPLPNPPLQYLEPVKYRCKDQEVSTTRWDAYCTDRGVIGPAASLYNAFCAPSAKPKPIPPSDFLREELISDLKCGQCFGMGTDRCVDGINGGAATCYCKEGWSVDHAVCVCDTDRCEVERRALNRSTEMKFLDAATMIAGPTFEFIVKMIMQVLTPDRGETIQDSIQFYRSQFVSCSGIFYAFGGAPQAMKLDIAERRAMSIMFHLPQILVHILYALEVMHIDAVRAGRSDNLWKSSGKDKNRWDYGWTYCLTIILGSAFSMAIWYFNWNTHQKAYTSLGIADVGSLGMLGWTAIAYCICAIYSFFKSMDIYLDGNRKKLETMRRDNKYETSKDPKAQEIEDKVWRNLIPCMIGAPLQCLYSISMISILAFDNKILKYINLVLLVANFIAKIHQSLRCDQPFLAWQLKWRMMTFRPLKEEFNKYSYLTTSEHFAKRSKALYKKNQQERLELEEAKRKEELDKIKDRIKKFQELGIPRQFHPHLPMKGPSPLKNYEYDPCEKDYIPEREREWKFCEWTKEYLGARVKLTITVADAIRKQAEIMFKEWSDMMELQDGMDYVEPTDAEKVFYDNIPAQFYNDMRGLSVACRVKEAGVDMKKQRLLEPVNQIFTFSCPEKEEAGPGLWADPFGFLWEKNIIKDLPVITREQENTVWNAIMNDYRKHNRLRDMIYDDDTLYSTLTRREVKGEKEVKKKDLEKKRMNRKKKGRFGRKREMKKDVEMGEKEEEEEEEEVQEQPWEAALRKEMNVQLAFPEGSKAHSINPRKHAVNYAELKQNRPNFVGPRQPQYYIPCGPMVRRFWLENYYAPRRELIFRMMCEQAGVRRHVS